MAQSVPVQNLYYLLLYAWNRVPEGRAIEVAGITSPELPNLIAKVLLDGVRNLLRRGLDRSYVATDEDLTRPRGRMRISDTLNRALMSCVQIACTTDDLSRDVLPNQIVKTTFERLVKVREIDPALHEGITALLMGLADIRSIPLSVRDFGRVQLHGNNAFYGFLLRVCALAHEALLPEPGTGRFRFRDVLADSTTMGYIFQDFVRNFFRLEQTQFTAKGDQVRWDVDPCVGSGYELLPIMNTDTSLYDGSRTIIVECKWTPHTLQTGRGGKKTLNEEHLRQLYAYVTNHPRTCTHSGTVEGLLLYPLVDDPVDVQLIVKGQRMRVHTIDFGVDWPDIRTQLLDLLEEVSLVGGSDGKPVKDIAAR